VLHLLHLVRKRIDCSPSHCLLHLLRSGRLVVHKPDLPPSFGVQEGLAAGCPAGLSPRSSRYASVAALRAYPGPNVFAIPGNQ
jgi:hypothetical protein